MSNALRWAEWLIRALRENQKPLERKLDDLRKDSLAMAATLESLTADVQKLTTDGAAFRAAVTAALAAIQAGGTLTAAQQAQVDQIDTMITTEDNAVLAAQAALPAPVVVAPAPAA